jgi:hypothetical protein
MKFNVYFGIAIQIIALCVVGMLWTLITPELRTFFGDTPFTKTTSNWRDPVDSEWNWGARHYWYFWMMFLLFILSAINCFMSIRKLVLKNYKI